jgi:SAM-dependent methyltransferase
MPSKIEDTRAMLARHHRDGDSFAELMKQTYGNRFNDEFWEIWQRFVAPELGPGSQVLDLGTGPGLFLKDLVSRYPQVQASGVDVAPYMLEAVETLPGNCSIISEDLHDPHLPFEDGSVDAALAAVVIHELNQPVRLLLEMQRCIRQGGVLFVLDWVRSPLQVYLENETELTRVFDPATDVDELEDMFIHFIEHNRFSTDDLVFMLGQCGFEIVHRDTYNNDRFARLVARRC